MIKLSLVLFLLTIPCFAEKYSVCVASKDGPIGCTHKKYSKKKAEEIRSILQTAPVPCEYDVFLARNVKKSDKIQQNVPSPKKEDSQGITLTNKTL